MDTHDDFDQPFKPDSETRAVEITMPTELDETGQPVTEEERNPLKPKVVCRFRVETGQEVKLTFLGKEE